MTFDFKHLDDETRRIMEAEIQDAVDKGTLYYSKRFNRTGAAIWASLLQEAARGENEHWLAYQLEARTAMKEFETRQRALGGYTTAHVPHTAAQTLADAEFNRYYMCAVCRLAAAAGRTVTVYRAKVRGETRVESDGVIGSEYDPAQLAEDLRRLPSGRPHPLVQPNSGLSVRITGA